jgi:hypothetical protein
MIKCSKAEVRRTFWAFPRDQWLSLLKEYLDFSDKHHKKYGFRGEIAEGWPR